MDWTYHKRNLVAVRGCYMSEYKRKTSFRLGAPV